jgi:2,4-dienoyl-CoA reductase (NADPH2)
VYGSDHFDRTPIQFDEIDLVVAITFEQPDEDLYFALKRAGQQVTRAGDCVAPRYMSQAILEGYRAGREL